MKKSIILATGLLLTTSAFASTLTVNRDATFTTDTYSTKAEAYNAGFDLVDSVKTMDQSQLRQEFPVATYSQVKNVSVDDSQVSVQEIATNRNNIEYRAVVDMGYHFTTHDDHN